MKQYLSFILAVLFLLYVTPVRAQQRQTTFALKGKNVAVNDIYQEPNGDRVMVGYCSDTTMSGSFKEPMILKINAAGDILWAQHNTLFDDYPAVRIVKAANGDYLLLGQINFILICRIAGSDGTIRWTRHITFSNTANNTVTGITELPDGSIAVCGTNDFDYTISSDIRQVGYIGMFDSVGNVRWLRKYGQLPPSWGYDQYYFHDIRYMNGRLYVCGYIDDSWINYHGLLMAFDTVGNIQATRVLSELKTSDSTALLWHNLLDLNIVNGQLYAGGLGAGDRDMQIVGLIDTGALSMSGYALSVDSGTSLWPPRYYINDSGDYYTAVTPSFYYNRKAYVSKINRDGTLAYSRKIEMDTTFWINYVYGYGDSVFVAGQLAASNGRQGFTGYFAMRAADACGITDTVLQLSSFTATSHAPGAAPMTAWHPLTSTRFPDKYWEPACIYSLYRCGDPVCPPVVHAGLDSLTDTRLCIGDTVQLFADGCYPKTWYRNGELLDFTDNLIKITKPGTYYVSVTNNACADTSARIVVDYKFRPAIHMSGDTLYSTPGASWQWLDSMGTILGATPYWVPVWSGLYRVVVTDSAGCAELSDPYYFRSPVGIGEVPGAAGNFLGVFPNPASSVLNVENRTHTDALFAIHDMNGRILRSWQQGPGIRSFRLQELGLLPGFYWLRMVQGQVCVGEKIVIAESSR